MFSTLHTIDASKTVDRIIGTFESGDQQAIRTRLANSFRYIVSQRLVPNKSGGRNAVLEILKSTMRTREYLERGEGEGRTLLDAMRDGELDGMQYFDGELEKLLRADVITRSTALLFATNAGNLQLQIADIPPDSGDPRRHHHAALRVRHGSDMGQTGRVTGLTRVGLRSDPCLTRV